MANEQLVAYIKQQTTKGVASDNIKDELLKVGWSAADVEEAVKSANSGTVATNDVVSNPVSAAAVSEPVLSAAGKVSESAIPEAKSKETDIKKIIDISAFGDNISPVSAGTAGSAVLESKLIDPKSLDSQKSSVKFSFGKWLPEIVMGVVIIALAGVAVVVFLKNKNLSASVASFGIQKSDLETQLAGVSKNVADLQSQVNSLKSDNENLNNQLSIFATPASTATSGPEEVVLAIKGTLETIKSQYILTTDKNIVVYVKNYKDAKVDAALKSLLGTVVEVSGVHAAGVANITVQKVNGVPVQ